MLTWQDKAIYFWSLQMWSYWILKVAKNEFKHCACFFLSIFFFCMPFSSQFINRAYIPVNKENMKERIHSSQRSAVTVWSPPPPAPLSGLHYKRTSKEGGNISRLGQILSVSSYRENGSDSQIAFHAGKKRSKLPDVAPFTYVYLFFSTFYLLNNFSNGLWFWKCVMAICLLYGQIWKFLFLFFK